MSDGKWEFLTQLLGVRVVDVGAVRDVLARWDAESAGHYPRLVAVAVGARFLPWDALSAGESGWVLAEGAADYAPQDDDLYLQRDILDKQIVDTGDALKHLNQTVKVLPQKWLTSSETQFSDTLCDESRAEPV